MELLIAFIVGVLLGGGLVYGAMRGTSSADGGDHKRLQRELSESREAAHGGSPRG